MQTGIYEAKTVVNIRREPRVVEYKIGGALITNQVGRISTGTRRFLDSFVTNKDNSTWGRVSEADSAGISEWICVKNINRTFMELVESTPIDEDDHAGSNLEERFARLEEWARTMGYNNPR